ncbi:hypothetical protein KQX54_020774 [Cotesia glomerata]|uniref:Uncharacterized protein n=1 Tax=Cotesia glomerata TaxID=32391 RepID=A0AAV7I4X6_COTGL|nr:hypothetical protein KQX54_020774 [Cotesia glomerata]
MQARASDHKSLKRGSLKAIQYLRNSNTFLKLSSFFINVSSHQLKFCREFIRAINTGSKLFRGEVWSSLKDFLTLERRKGGDRGEGCRSEADYWRFHYPVIDPLSLCSLAGLRVVAMSQTDVA